MFYLVSYSNSFSTTSRISLSDWGCTGSGWNFKCSWAVWLWPSHSVSFQMILPGWFFRARRTTLMPATSRCASLTPNTFPHVWFTFLNNSSFMLGVCVSVSQVAPPVSGTCLRYVAAQGPLPQTCTHFWQTVWEQQIHTIIMLTTLTERGRVYILDVTH